MEKCERLLEACKNIFKGLETSQVKLASSETGGTFWYVVLLSMRTGLISALRPNALHASNPEWQDRESDVDDSNSKYTAANDLIGLARPGPWRLEGITHQPPKPPFRSRLPH
jgi:hypothetical protein